MVTTIATTTNSTPFENQVTLFDRASPTGYMYAMVKASTANQYDLYQSINQGASWSLLLSVTRTNISEIGPIRILQPSYNQLLWCYRTNESSEDRIYVRSIPDLTAPVWSSETLVFSYPNGGVAGAVLSGMDMVCYTVPSVLHYTVIACGAVTGGTQGVSLFALAGGSLASQVVWPCISGSTYWRFPSGATGRCTPSLEIEHTGDGKTSSTPNLWCAFGRASLGVVKLPWTGSGWSGPSSYVLIRNDLGTDDSIQARWDGNRFVIAVPNPSAGLTDTVVVHERDRANSTTTTRTSPPHTTGVVRNCTLSYNAVNGDIRIYAIGTSTTVLYFIDYVRATGTWGTWATVHANALLGTAGNNYGVRRGSSGNAKHDVYTARTGAPNVLEHTSQSLTYTPLAPTWLSPTSGAAADVAVTLPLDWQFNDPDPADTQSAYALSRQIGAGTLTYWRASDSTWQAGEVQNTSGSTILTLPTSWAAHTDAAHTFKVKTWDSASVASVYSAGLIVIPSTPFNPTISTPTAAQVLTTDHVTMTWTVTEQTQFRVILNVTAGAQVYDSGWIAEAATRTYLIPYVLPNSTNWTITLQTKNNEGLSSALVTRQFTISYVVPMTPTVVTAPMPAAGYIRVAITNPTPGGGAPTLADQDLYRRATSDTVTTGVRVAAGLASGATYNDWQAVSGIDYSYRVFARGSNGTSVYGAWTP